MHDCFSFLYNSLLWFSFGTFYCFKMSSFLNYRYNETFDGVVLAYDPRNCSPLAKILTGINPYFGVKFEASLLLFNPKPNMLLGNLAAFSLLLFSCYYYYYFFWWDDALNGWLLWIKDEDNFYKWDDKWWLYQAY